MFQRLAALLLVSASFLMPAHAQQQPQTDLPRTQLSVGLYKIDAQIAQTPLQREIGLMFRKEMPQAEGMIFVFEQPATQCFWMRNTILPLDIVFVGADRRVLNVVHAVPYDETPLPSAGKAAMVLEINAGRAARLGIAPGTPLKW